ncbi:hypothetical protein DERF_014691 [Dermatophagoides farinae]|uniref:Uncharacterized protein n=1 Tax=Dermatophagoides farinae TaxID=6954 RepID=A0A922HMP4_DERFA|nr:hypothetical protein DERF_014691 [Dermatophagoides farinae]
MITSSSASTSSSSSSSFIYLCIIDNSGGGGGGGGGGYVVCSQFHNIITYDPYGLSKYPIMFHSLNNYQKMKLANENYHSDIFMHA